MDPWTIYVVAASLLASAKLMDLVRAALAAIAKARRDDPGDFFSDPYGSEGQRFAASALLDMVLWNPPCACPVAWDGNQIVHIHAASSRELYGRIGKEQWASLRSVPQALYATREVVVELHQGCGRTSGLSPRPSIWL